MVQNRIIILIFIILLSSVSITSAAQIASIAGSTTYTLKGDVTNSYQSRVVYLDNSSIQVYVSGISTLATRERKRNKGIWVSKFNTINEISTDIALNETQQSSLKIFDLQCLSVATNGNLIAISTTEQGQSLLISIGSDSKISVMNKLASTIHISKILSTADNKLILIGHKSSKSFVTKLSSSGIEEWSKVFNRGQDGTFVDGIVTSDGGFLLTENSGKFERFFIGESNLFVIKFDSMGNKKDEKYLPGRYGYIAKGKDGNFAVVYDKKTDSSQDIWVQAYDQNLSPIWNQKITETKFGLERFKITGLANGGFVVAGTAGGKPWLTYLDANGTKNWDYLSNSQDFENGIDIVSNGNDVYLVSTVIRLNDDKALNNKIKLIKFQSEQ